jgi:hypothetical protein
MPYHHMCMQLGCYMLRVTDAWLAVCMRLASVVQLQESGAWGTLSDCR